MRKASLAGEWYPATERALHAAIEECFTGERGPASTPREDNEPANAVIVPHDKLALSGQAAAWAYHALKGAQLFIILAPNLEGDEDGFSMETWKTPLGELRVDQHFLRSLAALGTIKANESIFEHQSALEMQLPFIQFIGNEGTKIAPLILSSKTDIVQLALDLKEALVDVDKKVSIVCVSHFTGNGRDYGRLRFTQDTQKQIYDFDKQAIDIIKRQDPDAFVAFVDKELANFTGSYAIELLLRLLKKSDVKLEQYYTSGDLTDYKNSVSYAAMVFEEKH